MKVVRSVPQMFHRRLLLLGALLVPPFGLVAAQMVNLSVGHRDEHLSALKSRLVRESWTPTVRGRILDRKGRVLAEDKPSFSVRVDYKVLSGSWARSTASRQASRYASHAWGALSQSEREALIKPIQEALDDHAARAIDEVSIVCGRTPVSVAERVSEIVGRVSALHDRMVSVWISDELARLAQSGKAITEERRERVTREKSAKVIREETQPHTLMSGVHDKAGFEVLSLLDDELTLGVDLPGGTHSFSVPRFPGFSVADSGTREYPYESMVVDVDMGTFPTPLRSEASTSVTVNGVATHMLGWMREKHYKEDVDARAALVKSDDGFRRRVTTNNGRAVVLGDGTPFERDRGAYQDGDRVGATGVEASLESALRGLRGLTVRRVDTGESLVLDQAPGQDARLTIDIALQARVQAAMTPELGLAVVQEWNADPANLEMMPVGTPIDGAAVVIEIDTGDILAMVTTPTFTRERYLSEFSYLVNDQLHMPLINRCVAKSYTPGSIVKALILSGAVTRGVLGPNDGIECNGHLYPSRTDAFRCWIYKRAGVTHSAEFGGALRAPDALMVSCNIFFFTLGQRLGVRGVVDTYRQFGVGTPWNLGVGVEHIGTLGRNMDGSDLIPGDAIQMGIGQGPVDWTPLHAADAYATLARGGVRVMPHVVADAAPEPVVLDISGEAVRLAMEGLWRSVNERKGTGNHLTINGKQEPTFNVPGVRVWGKTGTADAGIHPVDPDGAGPLESEELRLGDHSWFVVLAGNDVGAQSRPEYAIAVVMDHAGSGGRVSGPICNQVIAALVREGYLGSGQASMTGRSESIARTDAPP